MPRTSNNVLRLPTAYGTTLVVSELSTEPPSCAVAELSAEQGKVSGRLRGHYLSDDLFIVAGGLGIDEESINFKPAPTPGTTVSDYLLSPDGTPASGTRMPADGGYGEAAIATCLPGAYELNAHFTAAVVAIAVEYASGIRPSAQP